MIISPDAVVALIGVACFGLLLFPLALRWRAREDAVMVLSFYLALGLIWSIGRAVIQLDLIADPTTAFYFDWMADFSQMAMPVVFAALTLAFAGQIRALYWYWGVSAILLLLWIVLSLNLFNAATMALAYLPIIPSMDDLLNWLAIAFWGIATVVALLSLRRGVKDHPQAQYRNRFRYWLVGILILSAGNIILLLLMPSLQWIGAALNVVGALLVTYIVMRYHPPDLKLIVNRIMQSVTVTAVLAMVLFGALNLAYLMNDWAIEPQTALLWMILISIGLGFILPYLARWIEGMLSRVLFGGGGDEAGAALHAYSQHVNSDWDIAQISEQSLEFILGDLQVDRGAIFINQSESTSYVMLMSAASVEMDDLGEGYFASDSPWVTHLRIEQTSVTHYDLEVLPKFRDMDEENLTWLKSLDVDIFLPLILRRRELVGVLALGPKFRHRPYSERELRRLGVLTSQIALDLDKAKLFGQLGTVNQKLGELSTEFETFDKGKTDFLSIASHELRTPLTHIHGYASMLLEASEEDLQNPAYLQLILNGIAKGSTRLKDVVDLVFDVSKADIGQLEVARSWIALAEVVKEATENQQDGLDERGHTLIVSGLDTLPLIEGDMTRLVQAMTHLLNNAIKYTPDDGTITITGRAIKEKGEVAQVEIIVTDTGIGVNPDDHQRIFEKFYRVGSVENHSTGTVKFKGAGPGLGLPLVKGIAKAHGGDVWVESPEYNEETFPGSQFHLVLPVKAPEKAPRLTKEAPSMQDTRHWRGKEVDDFRSQMKEERE